MDPSDMEELGGYPLEESPALLKLTLRAAQAGSWAWDFRTGEIFWSEEFHHLIGSVPSSSRPTYETWLPIIHPEDLEGAVRERQEALAERRELNNEFRIIRPDGTVRWMRTQGQGVYGPDGTPLRMVGVMFDVTERRRAEEKLRGQEARLRESEERFRTAVENMLDSFGIYTAVRNEEGRIVDFRIEYVNAAACSNNLMERQEQIGRLLCDILPAHRESGLFAEYCRVVETGEPLVKEMLVYTDEYASRRLERSFDIRAVKHGDGFFATWRDVTERKRSEEALREADRRKDEFLAMLAHELRNPLASIRNAAHVMRRLGIEDARFLQMRNVVERQTDQLARMVDDLLDVSRISLGKISLRKEKADLLTIVGRAVETSRPLIDQRGHRLHVSLPAESLQLDADVPRLAQALSNLLNNAAKYTEPGGHVWLTAEAQGSEVQIRVKDDGIGMPPELLPHIFDLFTQADRTIDRSQGGLGIGLTLVKTIVEMHGGTVRAFSEGPGRGSELVLSLPKPGARSVPPGSAGAGGFAAGGGDLSENLRILVVDDSIDTAESLALLLGLEGQEVRMAHDGLHALEIARAFLPHVVLLDIGLPKLNGFEVARHLREQPETQRTLLLALSGYGREGDRQKALESGFNHHLTKPVDYEALKALINGRAFG